MSSRLRHFRGAEKPPTSYFQTGDFRYVATFLILTGLIPIVDQNEDTRRIDQALVEQVLRGDTKAFALIIKKTEGLVAQIIFKMIANREDRKDIAQDVYLKAFQHLNGFRFQAKLSTWIGQIAYHTCLTCLEKKKLVLVDYPATEPDHESLDRLGVPVNPFENEIENQMLDREFSQLVATEIDKLAPLYKTLLTLYHQEDVSYREIAQIVQLPEGTVKSYLFRARKILRDQILRTYNPRTL
ncbi:RNA polymerase sigma factor [Larkinella rosea]|uniref:Sigma-70 family RNA polymerase sigma factor n=1 Tax=Larkinella rosea TaxID=2025312 RepID=A0A3P1BJH7_9BACT|nr:sigma-70 family RNA polymerase sigma factor [Larkinella rosea]RRB01142.1 sigma-70 family RNA polymerase sigma factor [Larkinella rosea]